MRNPTKYNYRSHVLWALLAWGSLAGYSDSDAGEPIWFEAEHAQWATFDDIYLAAGLSSGKGLHFSTDSEARLGEYTARYEIEVPVGGTYELWGRRHLYYHDEGNIPLITHMKRYVELIWRVDDGPWQGTDSNADPTGLEGPYPTSIGHLGYTRTGTREMAGKTIGWYRDGELDLSPGPHVLEISLVLRQETVTPLFEPRLNRYYGVLDAFVIADSTFEPGGRTRPVSAIKGIADIQSVRLDSTEIRILATATGDTIPNLIGINGFSLSKVDSGYTEQIQALRPELWRVSHLYNKAKVTRNTDGELVFDWTELDREIDAIRALGIEPMMCISYTPEFLSSMPSDTPRGAGTGDPGLYPPSDYDVWEEVVYRTVAHYNVERGLNIRYWSVWNEPNNIFLNVWHIWEWTRYLPFSAFIDDIKKSVQYLSIYESAVRGAVKADPSIQVGGPTVLCDGDVEDFTGSVGRWVQMLRWWCDWRELPLDFVAVHFYAGPPDSQAPEDYGDLIRRVRHWATRADGSVPEVIIDEWNAWSMEGGHDNATEYNAIWTLESLGAMFEAGARHSVYYANAEYLSLLESDFRTPRPVYHAFKMFSELDGQRLISESDAPDTRVIATRADRRLTILIWRFGTVHREADVVISELPSDIEVQYRSYLVDEGHSNFQLGQAQSGLYMSDEGKVVTTSAGELELRVRLPRTSAVLVDLLLD
ncbi:MAG: hypothetical protein HOH43_07415 [Candidatus Latescibacteria bacterium]|nr:hypothetical protein [Candidatus Latescibacterota bacterium]